MAGKFEWTALTKMEQYIFLSIYNNHSATNAMHIYFDVARNYIMIDVLPDYLELYGKKRRVLNAFLDKQRKKQRKKGAKIPAYTTIIRILENFTSVGWVKTREEITGRASILYFLSNEVHSEVEKAAVRAGNHIIS